MWKTIEKQIVKMHFLSPLHLARGKSDYESSYDILHADTLKSAIFVCALQLYSEEEIKVDFLEKFTISSAFPFFKDEYFFPKPFCKIHRFAKQNEEDEAKQSKKLKKISFLGKNYFENLLQGEVVQDTEGKTHLKKEIDPTHLVQDEYVTDSVDVLKAQEEWKNKEKTDFNILRSSVSQRVTIPYNHEGDPTPFYMERLYFTPDAGLFFMIDFHDDSIKDKVWAALKLLGDNGIGTDKNVGNGQFEIKESEKELTLSFQVNPTAKKQVNLSLYCPLELEIEGDILDNSAYNLIKRGGYIATPTDEVNIKYRKKSIFMFAEGSVFPILTENRKGKVVDLKPEILKDSHPIWRDGRAMFLPIQPIL